MATVLLVEDDPAARHGLELALRRLGYGVRAAETGEVALRDFRDAAADVVVLDLMLPGLDGFEVCRRLRRGSDIPVIMLTARGDDLDIVGGLVGNALRHGGPPVTVTVGIQPDGRGGGQLAMEVRDHGHGLAPAAIPHVFDRFYKADTARARSDGSGLGLPIAWENARLHGGDIHAGNHPGGGAVFTVSLPLDAPGSP